MKKSKRSSRREFLSKLTLGAAAVSVPGILTASPRNRKEIEIPRRAEQKKYAANDKIRLATIGYGIQGTGDTAGALDVDGVEFVAACDLYDGRLQNAKEKYGKDIFTTRDYREILSRKDIDAVIIAVPDHWHQRIGIDAMKAKKAVYLEKPMVKRWEDGQSIINAEKENNAILQIGSQGISGLADEKARELYLSGAIGDLIMVEIFNDRYSAEGAWQYPIPPDASPSTIDFDKFLGTAPKVPFDPTRFFRWRNYQDYGTGVAGDLFVHSFTSLHYVIDSHGPVRAVSTGGTRFWKDGRDVPDIMLSLYDFPQTKTHPAFNAILRINFTAGNGGGGGFRLIGSEGEISLGWQGVTVKKQKMGMKPSGYSLKAYSKAMRDEIVKEYDAKYADRDRSMNPPDEVVYNPPKDYKGADYDHFVTFFNAMRGDNKIRENATYGLRAAGAALLSNYSYFGKKIVNWDPEAMKLL